MDSYVGKRLDGRYEIREIIGVGGMAVVYKAYDNIDDRIVAIKILKEEFLANEEFRRRFKNESKAIAVLSHPNIVKVYDVSLGDRLQYIVMEYVEGITLKEYIEHQGSINWKEAVHFATQILRALQHAHDKGIVHRDIKPQNIMLLENGTIKVTDFGIARFSRGETRTMTESAIGSVHYISPEQARGETTDDKADIYSVGVVLYEMITGQLPFESDSAVSVALMQVKNEATPPREINPEIPVGLEQITLHAMEKSPKNRYQSAAEFLLDLDELKRNPTIKFDYTYFVDKEPTKFINRGAVERGLQDGASQSARRVNVAAPELSQTGLQEEPVIPRSGSGNAKQNKQKSIAGGVIAAVAIAAVLIILILYFFTDLFTGEKVEVPNFMGMSYSDEIEGKYDDFEFDVTYVTSSTYKKGQVCKQDPEAGSSIKAGSTVKLEVVGSGTLEEVPDVSNMSETQAKRTLTRAGFENINTETEYSDSVTAGRVIRSDPKAGTEADTQEVIVLYIATDVNENEVAVPDIIGYNYNETSGKSKITSLLDKAGLSVGNVTSADSDKEAGTVIAVSPDVGTNVDKGSAVDIVISNGVATIDVSFTLPSDNESRSMAVYLDGTQIEANNVICDGRSVSVTTQGSSDGSKFEVRLDGTTYYTCTVNFAKGKITNEKTTPINNNGSLFNVGN